MVVREKGLEVYISFDELLTFISEKCGKDLIGFEIDSYKEDNFETGIEFALLKR